MNRYIRIIAASVFFATMLGCSSRVALIHNPETFSPLFVPKNNEGWGVSKLGGQDPVSKMPRFDCAYIYLRRFEGKTLYFFYRFWPDGGVAHRSYALTKMPTLQDFESLEGCHLGRYELRGNSILCEFFTGEEGGTFFRTLLEPSERGYMDYRYTAKGWFFPEGRKLKGEPRHYVETEMGSDFKLESPLVIMRREEGR